MGKSFRWVACLGRIGIAATKPLTKLANSMSKKTEYNLDNDAAMRSALSPRVSFIANLTDGSLPPALFSISNHVPPILIFSDASWSPCPPRLYGTVLSSLLEISTAAKNGITRQPKCHKKFSSVFITCELKSLSSVLSPQGARYDRTFPDAGVAVRFKRSRHPSFRRQPRSKLHRHKRLLFSSRPRAYCERCPPPHRPVASQMVDFVRSFSS